MCIVTARLAKLLDSNKVLDIKAKELNKPISLIDQIIAANRTMDLLDTLQA